MKKNITLKNMLKHILCLVLSLMVIVADAKIRGDKSGTVSSSARRVTQQRSRGAQRRSPQGRYAPNTRQQPVKKRAEQTTPTEEPLTTSQPTQQSLAQASQQPASANVNANAAKKWTALKRLLLNKKGSPAEALELVKKIRTKKLTDEQEEWLDMFEGWMELAKLQKSGQSAQGSSINKPDQQTTVAQQTSIPGAIGLSSAPKQQFMPASGNVDEKQWQEIIEELNKHAQSPSQDLVESIKNMQLDPRFTAEQQEFLRQFQQRMQVAIASRNQVGQSVEGSAIQPQRREGELMKYWNDPNKTFLGIPVSNASRSQQPVSNSLVGGGGPSVKVEEPKSVVQIPTQPKRQGALQQAWAKTPTVYQLVGGADPNLASKPAPEGSVKQPKKPGALQEAWSTASIYSLMGGSDPNLATKPTGQASVTESQPGINEIEGWRLLQEDLEKEAENPSSALVNRIEEIRRHPYFNTKQQEWLEKFQQYIERSIYWKDLRSFLEAQAENPSPALIQEVERIINTERWLSPQQVDMLREFQETMRALMPK